MHQKNSQPFTSGQAGIGKSPVAFSLPLDESEDAKEASGAFAAEKQETLADDPGLNEGGEGVVDQEDDDYYENDAFHEDSEDEEDKELKVSTSSIKNRSMGLPLFATKYTDSNFILI